MKFERPIVFLGAGQMATAIAAGFVGPANFPAHLVQAIEISDWAAEKFRAAIPGCKLISKSTIPDDAEFLIVAVKPQFLIAATEDLEVPADCCVVSIVAGASLNRLNSLLKTKQLVRAMPNTPALVGRGATSLTFASGVSESSKSRIDFLFRSTGITVHVDENMIDIVTGLSGSGPAYVFRFAEAMIDAGVELGMARDVARTLALQTINGAVSMITESGEHPRVLAERVTSPAGTTAAALRTLDESGFSRIVMEAVAAAADRSAAIAMKLDQ